MAVTEDLKGSLRPEQLWFFFFFLNLQDQLLSYTKPALSVILTLCLRGWALSLSPAWLLVGVSEIGISWQVQEAGFSNLKSFKKG